MEKHYTLCIQLALGVAGICLLKLDLLILPTIKCMNNQPYLNKKGAKLPTVFWPILGYMSSHNIFSTLLR